MCALENCCASVSWEAGYGELILYKQRTVRDGSGGVDIGDIKRDGSCSI